MVDIYSIQADLETHHIEGYALANGQHFSVPLISHIEGNLWTGGCRSGVRLPDDFDTVVSLYPWERFELGPATSRLEVQMYDHDGMPDLEVLHRTAEAVIEALDAGPTLVHCQAGLNRSGLVAGLALVKMGRSPEEAIALLREKRSSAVLCNRTFEQWLLGQGGGAE